MDHLEANCCKVRLYHRFIKKKLVSIQTLKLRSISQDIVSLRMKHLLSLAILASIFTVFASDADLKTTKFRFYTGSDISAYTEYAFNDAPKILENASFDNAKPTVMYIHGWNEQLAISDALIVVVNGFLAREDHNIVALNYEPISNKPYTTAIDLAYELGKLVAPILADLFNNGLSLDNFYLVGFSLGAHIAGLIGRTLKSSVPSVSIPRITGLDPAGPSFYGTGKFKEINKGDANFVDIIHTDKGIFGGPKSSGHADFYPNGGGRPQPGCGLALLQILTALLGNNCPHVAACRYYAQSLASPTIFLATNRLTPTNKVHMGYYCSPTASGDYDLKTA